MENRKCPICGGEFKEGRMIPSGYKGLRNIWAEGEARLDFLGRPQGKAREVVTYRCKNCGYLENYAK